MKILDIYTDLLNNGLTVTSFNSDNNTINIKQITSNEVLCIKRTLNACGYNVTIELLDSALYQLHFNF